MKTNSPKKRAGFSKLMMAAPLACAALLYFTADKANAEPKSDLAEFHYYTPGDGSHRINMSGKLRMLSQRIPGLACNAAAGIAPDQSMNAMYAATTEFERILAALTVGDDGLKITAPEQNRRTLVFIDEVAQVWAPFARNAADVGRGADAFVQVAGMAEESGPLLASAVDLVNRIVGVYYDPVTTRQSDALTIDYAGRQRMLAQRMSKNVCLMNEGVTVAAAQAELAEAYRLFDATLAALQTGMPSAGVSPPPNDAVVAGLDIVVAAWADMAPLMQRAIAGETFDQALRAQVFHGMNDLTSKMNDVVHTYSDATTIGGPTQS